jgi:predicted ATPase
MIQKQIYIITGGPGFGKTQLIEELKLSGYHCSGEFARDLIENQIISGGEILPWKNTRLFQQEVLGRRIIFFESVPNNLLAFADRGIPDQLAFARFKGFGSPEVLMQNAQKYRYASQVFITPPWPEIYKNDQIRKESFDEAVQIHLSIVETYLNLNYQIIDLPLTPVKNRVDFILQTIKNLNHDEYEPT